MQKYTSEKTSLNQVPALHKKVYFVAGTTNLDIGGGAYDTCTAYMEAQGVNNLVYDPYNRTDEHNANVLNECQAIAGADTATISNVLNVIMERDIRRDTLLVAARNVRTGGMVYITVYEGNGTGNGRETSKGWQNNAKLKWYLDEVREIFPSAEIKNGIISAKKEKK